MPRGIPICLALACLAVWPLSAQRIKLSVGLAELESRVKKDSNDAVAHYNVALGYWSAKRYDDAERELRAATVVDPEFAAPYLALSYLPFARRTTLWEELYEHRLSDSLRQVLDAAALLERHAYLIDPLVDTRVVGATTPGKSVFFDIIDEYHDFYDYYYQGIDDLDQGNYEQARGRFQRFINDIKGQNHPDRIPSVILWWHGLAAAHVQRFDDAIADFSILLDRSTKIEKRDSLLHVPLRTNEWRYMLADLYRRAGKFEAAVPLYRDALENDIGLYEAHVQLAEIAESNNNLEAAIAERRAAVDANPDDSGLMLAYGVTLGSSGDLANAEEVLKQTIQLNPREVRSYFYLGIVEQRLGNLDGARSNFTTFVALAPSRYDRQIQSARQFLAQR